MLTSQRHLFSLGPREHYLNCAYMSPLAQPVEAAANAAMVRRRNPARIRPEDFFTEADRARALFAQLVNAPEPSRVAFVPAVSYGMATIAKNLRLGRLQNVVVADAQFPSTVYSWRRVCGATGAELRTVSPPAGSARRGQEWNARLLDAIDGGTALVALGNVHWTDGTRFDLVRIGERARQVGALFVVDGTQSAGAMPFDVQEVRPDALICASYKTMMGPYGLGVAWFGPRFDLAQPLEETWLGRRGSEDFTRLAAYRDEYQPGAARFDMGGRSSFVSMSMLIAALELLLRWRPGEVQAYCRELVDPVLAEAEGLGYLVEEPAWRASHIVGLRLPPTVALARLQTLCAEAGVVVAARGDAVRVSPSSYNEESDMTALLDALRSARL